MVQALYRDAAPVSLVVVKMRLSLQTQLTSKSVRLSVALMRCRRLLFGQYLICANDMLHCVARVVSLRQILLL